MKYVKTVTRVAPILLAVAMLLSGCTMLPSAVTTVSNALSATQDEETVTLSKAEYDRLERYASLDEIFQNVETYYYIQPDEDAMLEGAKRGLLAGLDDPYTYYYNPEEFAAMWEDDGGEYAGIGIQISASYETLLCTISRVFTDSPAEAVGLRKGDVLIKVEDVDVSASTLTEAVNIMRGEVGTTVHVQVSRGDTLLDFDIPRAVVHVNWVSSCMLDDQVGYLLLYEFSGDCADKFADQLNALVEQGAKALVLDLRDNPGGWVDDAVKIADHFLPEETITYLEDRSGQREFYKATAGALDIPLVILMNENSASASEIVAGAMQDYGRATVVGTQSYGKGVVQYVLPLSDGSDGMQLTSAQYFTPNGRSIHKVGITPDVLSELPDGDTTLYELGDRTDPQLEKAYEVALEKLSGSFVVITPTPTPAPTPQGEVGADASGLGEDASGAADTTQNFVLAVS